MATMQCDVVSVKESIYSGAVTMLIAKGAGGELGILPGHAPLVTLLQPYSIRVLLENGTEEIVYVSGGVLEVQPHVVTVLADTAIRADNLDEAAILEARKNAEQLLANQKSDLDSAAALAALAETAAQLETIRKIKTALNKTRFEIEKPPFGGFLLLKRKLRISFESNFSSPAIIIAASLTISIWMVLSCFSIWSKLICSNFPFNKGMLKACWFACSRL